MSAADIAAIYAAAVSTVIAGIRIADWRRERQQREAPAIAVKPSFAYLTPEMTEAVVINVHNSADGVPHLPPHLRVALVRSGAQRGPVRRWLGHHSPAFTLSVYVHLLNDDLGGPLSMPQTPSKLALIQPPAAQRAA